MTGTNLRVYAYGVKHLGRKIPVLIKYFSHISGNIGIGIESNLITSGIAVIAAYLETGTEYDVE